MTPVSSFLSGLFEVSTGAHNISTINFFGQVVLGIAALDGLLMGLKYFIMETAGNAWALRIRRQGFANVLAQDKKGGERGCETGADASEGWGRCEEFGGVNYGTGMCGCGDGEGLVGLR
jgi:ATP-binding cassette subfamily B (MDR/TAP) protein 1